MRIGLFLELSFGDIYSIIDFGNSGDYSFHASGAGGKSGRSPGASRDKKVAANSRHS